jgi:hypothetical protein
MIAKRYIVRGRVQGVGFRWFVDHEARFLGPAGSGTILMALWKRWLLVATSSMWRSPENYARDRVRRVWTK